MWPGGGGIFILPMGIIVQGGPNLTWRYSEPLDSQILFNNYNLDFLVLAIRDVFYNYFTRRPVLLKSKPLICFKCSPWARAPISDTTRSQSCCLILHVGVVVELWRWRSNNVVVIVKW